MPIKLNQLNLSRRFDSIGPTDLVTDRHRQIQTRPVYFSWYLPGAAAPGEYDRALVCMSFQSCSRIGLVDYTVGQKTRRQTLVHNYFTKY